MPDPDVDSVRFPTLVCVQRHGASEPQWQILQNTTTQPNMTSSTLSQLENDPMVAWMEVYEITGARLMRVKRVVVAIEEPNVELERGDR
jgi:hypothetical protein